MNELLTRVDTLERANFNALNREVSEAGLREDRDQAAGVRFNNIEQRVSGLEDEVFPPSTQFNQVEARLSNLEDEVFPPSSS